MKKINFVNGETIDGASTFNTMQDNIEDVFNGNESMGSIVVDDITCKNLFDKNNVYINKALNDGDGTVFEATNRNTTDFIVVKPSSNYIFSNISRTAVCLYDKNKKFIKTFQNNSIATTSDTYYLRFTYKTDEDYSKGQLETGSVATNYVEHKEFTLPYDASSVGNAIFTKYGHLVIVSGWFILNGSEATFKAPYKPTSQCWFPTNGVSPSVDASGVSGFVIIYPDNGNIMIKMSGAITYCTTGFCYYTND